MRSARTIPSAPSTFSCHVYPRNARPWFRGCSPVVSCSRYSGRLSEAREPVLSGRIVELFGDSVATRGDAIHGARVHPASIRLAKGEARSVDEARAHLFDEHELVEAHALLLQPLFFEWDDLCRAVVWEVLRDGRP